MTAHTSKKAFVIFSAITVWFALLLQFNISLGLLDGDYLATAKLFFSFFTILSNVIVAICFTCLWLFPKKPAGLFFSKTTTLTAITIYIVVVGVIYNLLLRGLISHVGWARVADELLHVVSPLLFLIFWVFFTNKSGLKYADAITWLIYPLVYVVFIIIRGYLINQYPYPFINVVNLGYQKALTNAFMILIFFWLLSLLFIFVARKISKR
ncbi:Pr6Pr family membrane protein [Pedobacter aquatilis]|uniref:Pr6Pr family membrane protein n=1 Tax=Pedobacter aquatilis TaxID=351343 RepID=UPI00292F1602|nr:Pr6Pr family membrane protein [Pedobacter aquatilis]